MPVNPKFTDAQYARWYERAMVIAQRSDADRLEAIKRLLTENHELRLICASRVTPAKAQELMVQIGRLMQERDRAEKAESELATFKRVMNEGSKFASEFEQATAARAQKAEAYHNTYDGEIAELRTRAEKAERELGLASKANEVAHKFHLDTVARLESELAEAVEALAIFEAVHTCGGFLPHCDACEGRTSTHDSKCAMGIARRSLAKHTPKERA